MIETGRTLFVKLGDYYLLIKKDSGQIISIQQVGYWTNIWPEDEKYEEKFEGSLETSWTFSSYSPSYLLYLFIFLHFPHGKSKGHLS
jgi:hypothetical protein